MGLVVELEKAQSTGRQHDESLRLCESRLEKLSSGVSEISQGVVDAKALAQKGVDRAQQSFELTQQRAVELKELLEQQGADTGPKLEALRSAQAEHSKQLEQLGRSCGDLTEARRGLLADVEKCQSASRQLEEALRHAEVKIEKISSFSNQHSEGLAEARTFARDSAEKAVLQLRQLLESQVAELKEQMQEQMERRSGDAFKALKALEVDQQQQLERLSRTSAELLEAKKGLGRREMHLTARGRKDLKGSWFGLGLVRDTNVINTMMMSVASMAIVCLTWVVFGFSWAFGDNGGGFGMFVGNFEYSFWMNLDMKMWGDSGLPGLCFAAFQMTFAIIASAIISGSLVERMRFSAYSIMLALWSLLIYAPLCHWVWGPNGWIAEMGALDFAGGTVVHISSGVSGLVAGAIVGPRRHVEKELGPANAPFVILGGDPDEEAAEETGGSLLWFGWLGFNGGSALSVSDGVAARAVATTFVAAASSMLSWLMLERLLKGKSSSVGASVGAVAGLVCITPGAGFVTPGWSIVIGPWAQCLGVQSAFEVWCYVSVEVVNRVNLVDDTLDAFGLHGMGGIGGAILTGIFALDGGLIYTGNFELLGKQIAGAMAGVAFSAIGTAIIVVALRLVMRVRIPEEQEIEGVDQHTHGETYHSPVKKQLEESLRHVDARLERVSLVATQSSEGVAEVKTLALHSAENAVMRSRDLLEQRSAELKARSDAAHEELRSVRVFIQEEGQRHLQASHAEASACEHRVREWLVVHEKEAQDLRANLDEQMKRQETLSTALQEVSEIFQSKVSKVTTDFAEQKDNLKKYLTDALRKCEQKLQALTAQPRVMALVMDELEGVVRGVTQRELQVFQREALDSMEWKLERCVQWLHGANVKLGLNPQGTLFSTDRFREMLFEESDPVTPGSQPRGTIQSARARSGSRTRS
ncbi:unnamed protein product [Durusdinium trenchii]|uniref:Ammonium transporter AmtB-like domain-containing protein n=1 Tax=Durusdinium trenchii TaxID=1381693 RepID=A0ABP0SFJ3_9DINO